MRLQSTRVLITGGGAGIGRAIHEVFAKAKEGAYIVVCDINKEGGLETVELVKTQGGQPSFVHAVISIKSDVDNLFLKLYQNWEASIFLQIMPPLLFLVRLKMYPD